MKRVKKQKTDKVKRSIDDTTVDFLQELGSALVAGVLVFGALKVFAPDIWNA